MRAWRIPAKGSVTLGLAYFASRVEVFNTYADDFQGEASTGDLQMTDAERTAATDDIITLTIRGRDDTLGLSIAHLEKVVGSVGSGEKLITESPNGPFAVSCSDGFLICASKTIDTDGMFVTMYAKLDESKLDAAHGLRGLWASTRGPFSVSDVMGQVQKLFGKPN